MGFSLVDTQNQNLKDLYAFSWLGIVMWSKAMHLDRNACVFAVLGKIGLSLNMLKVTHGGDSKYESSEMD